MENMNTINNIPVAHGIVSTVPSGDAITPSAEGWLARLVKVQ
jgi:hypothetical protein